MCCAVSIHFQIPLQIHRASLSPAINTRQIQHLLWHASVNNTNNTTSSSHSSLHSPKQMSSSRRKTPRKPLSNLTNTIPNVTSSSSSSTPTIKPISKTSLTKNNNTQFANLSDDVVSNSPNPKTPSLFGDGGRREPGSVYTRRKSTAKSKLKGKDASINAGLDRDEVNKTEVVVHAKSSMKPPKKKKRKTSSVEDVANHSLPQDFIERQRAYFAEIDAFELSEEEASADELE